MAEILPFTNYRRDAYLLARMKAGGKIIIVRTRSNSSVSQIHSLTNQLLVVSSANQDRHSTLEIAKSAPYVVSPRISQKGNTGEAVTKQNALLAKVTQANISCKRLAVLEILYHGDSSHLELLFRWLPLESRHGNALRDASGMVGKSRSFRTHYLIQCVKPDGSQQLKCSSRGLEQTRLPEAARFLVHFTLNLLPTQSTRSQFDPPLKQDNDRTRNNGSGAQLFCQGVAHMPKTASANKPVRSGAQVDLDPNRDNSVFDIYLDVLHEIATTESDFRQSDQRNCWSTNIPFYNLVEIVVNLTGEDLVSSWRDYKTIFLLQFEVQGT
ncbi:hypothetical protein C8J56DRAFT_904695 [Mycena floridula]|nr:hypothetical protein C8J56DRAFT_905184 [Mycena floridula]KAJ7572878.1 hypothetical protein C8J56DRAFT_904695 [Mycena floridula]